MSQISIQQFITSTGSSFRIGYLDSAYIVIKSIGRGSNFAFSYRFNPINYT